MRFNRHIPRTPLMQALYSRLQHVTQHSLCRNRSLLIRNTFMSTLNVCAIKSRLRFVTYKVVEFHSDVLFLAKSTYLLYRWFLINEFYSVARSWKHQAFYNWIVIWFRRRCGAAGFCVALPRPFDVSSSQRKFIRMERNQTNKIFRVCVFK